MSHLKIQKQYKNKCESHSGYIYLLHKAKHLPCFKSFLQTKLTTLNQFHSSQEDMKVIVILSYSIRQKQS